MLVAILHNADHDREDDPGREARQDVLQVAAALEAALRTEGLGALPVAVGRDPFLAYEALRRLEPDVVVNVCESIGGDARGEAVATAALERLGIPYTGSGPRALRLALDKARAKEALRARGVRTPEHARVRGLDELPAVDLPFPLIVKPVREDASVGITTDSVVRDRRGLERAVSEILRGHRQPALVERFVDGREVYVPLLGNAPRRALPLSEIAFGPAFQRVPRVVSYRAKWDPDSEEYRDTPSVPCTLPPDLAERAAATALAAFEALGCADYGRVDLRVTPEGVPYVIEVNPNCDLHPQAGFARAAAAAGLGYPALARRLVALALEKTHGHPPHDAGRPARHPAPARDGGELLERGGRLRAGGAGRGPGR